ncbi:hypothetical protein LR48_Vigan02g044100 [Vigna angularis]|uniref:Uncharacterized protein n=1 Tax=Phaseolus angularis TaxID=3914 RepID=A0A0L9TUW2_PHAAN|nr:hypothetical protein LR48_Vigan02g044100 [Vigna angularis]
MVERPFNPTITLLAERSHCSVFTSTLIRFSSFSISSKRSSPSAHIHTDDHRNDKTDWLLDDEDGGCWALLLLKGNVRILPSSHWTRAVRLPACCWNVFSSKGGSCTSSLGCEQSSPCTCVFLASYFLMGQLFLDVGRCVEVMVVTPPSWTVASAGSASQREETLKCWMKGMSCSQELSFTCCFFMCAALPFHCSPVKMIVKYTVGM